MPTVFERKLTVVAAALAGGWCAYWQWRQISQNYSWQRQYTDWTRIDDQLAGLSKILVGHLTSRGDWSVLVRGAAAVRERCNFGDVRLSNPGTVSHTIVTPFELLPQIGWYRRHREEQRLLTAVRLLPDDGDLPKQYVLEELSRHHAEPRRHWLVNFEMPLKIAAAAEGGAPYRLHMLRAEGCLRVLDFDAPLPPSVEYKMGQQIADELGQSEHQQPAAVDHVHNAVFEFFWRSVTIDNEQLFDVEQIDDRTFLRVYQSHHRLGETTIPSDVVLAADDHGSIEQLGHALKFYYFFKTQ